MSAREIVGFPARRGDTGRHRGTTDANPRFELEEALQSAKDAEIARIATIAERLSRRLGATIAVGFLYCELLGRLPQGAEGEHLAARLDRAPSTAPSIAAELSALALAERAQAGPQR